MISPALSRRAAVAVNALQLAGRTAEADAISLAETQEELEEALALTAAAWDESKHPREGRGRREGGRFRGGTVTNEMHALAGTPIALLNVGDQFVKDGKAWTITRTERDGLSVYATSADGVEREFNGSLESTDSTITIQAQEPPEGSIEVTGKSLKGGSKFWGYNGRDGTYHLYEVPLSEGQGTAGRFLRVTDTVTGKQAVMRRSTTVRVNPDDFPAAAKRAAKVATNSVEGEYGKVFSQSPGAGSKVTKAATVASKEAGSILTIPDGVMTPIPLKETRSMSFGGSISVAVSDTREYIPKMVNLRAGDETPMGMRDNMHHEMGHFIDYDGMDTEIGQTASVTRDPLVAGPVMDAIDNSRAWERIRTMRESSNPHAAEGYSIVVHAGTPQERRMSVDRSHLDYLADPTEKFARAYEQYVATKVGGGDATRLARYRDGTAAPLDVTDFRSDGTGPSYRSFYGWYWDDEDFKPIATAFDEMFGRAGWLKN